jgi:hypothetical protein
MPGVFVDHIQVSISVLDLSHANKRIPTGGAGQGSGPRYTDMQKHP